MSQFILDIQGFKNNLNKFIVKEIAIYSVDGNLVKHCFLKSPISFNELSTFYKKQAIFNQSFYHGIPWNMGENHFHTLHTQLQEIFGNGCKIFVKGLEKAKFIQEVFPDVDAIDLGDKGFPSLKKMTQNYKCSFHKYTKYMCAHDNVKKILCYIQQNKIMLD